ncbi:hypothetical protein C8R43DRAFT_1131111 [Mycena crocata]|nr:hypothetical protein C8R43DRAFT_1131111 [Mycena crocata]
MPDIANAPSEPQRVPGLWFEDGNIVIQAGNSQFRVFRGILAGQSSVFRDMLSFPQPADSEIVDGCSLVRLPDSQIDVTVFLKAIFEPRFFMPFPAPTNFDTVIGCLLSDKYEVDYLRSRSLVHLSSRYLTQLSGLDDADQRNASVLKIPSWSLPVSWVHRIVVIQLARELGCPWILPFAFYSLSTVFPDLGSVVFYDVVHNGVSVSLSPQDQQVFLQGHHIQCRRAVTDILAFLLDPSDIQGCSNPDECPGIRLEAYRDTLYRPESVPSSPLNIWNSRDWIQLKENICATCLVTLMETHQEAREDFWEELPEMYGLPPWSDLEDARTTVIGAEFKVLA